MNSEIKLPFKELMKKLSPEKRAIIMAKLIVIAKFKQTAKEKNNLTSSELILNIDKHLDITGNEFILLLKELQNYNENFSLLDINIVDNLHSISISEKEIDLQVKLIIKGVQLVDLYISIGITNFSEIAYDSAVRHNQISKSFIDALKKTYIFGLLNNRELSSTADEVINYDFENLQNIITSEKEAHLISKGIQLINLYRKKDICEFADILKHAVLEFGEFTEDFLLMMKTAYLPSLLKPNNLSNSFNDVLLYTMDDLIESYNNISDKKDLLVYTLLIHLKENVPHTYAELLKENYLSQYIRERVDDCLKEFKIYTEKSDMDEIEAKEVAISSMLGLI